VKRLRSSDRACEFGHLWLDQKERICKCGNRGCWELSAFHPAALKRLLNRSFNSAKLLPPTQPEIRMDLSGWALSNPFFDSALLPLNP